MREKATLKLVGEAETQSHYKPMPGMPTHNQEGPHNPKLLPEE